MRKILLVFSSLISIKYVIALNLSPLFNFNFTYCKSFALEENTLTHSFQNRYSKQINHLHQGFPYGWGDQDIPLRNGTLVFLTPAKKLSSPILFLITDHILGKKTPLIAFRQTFLLIQSHSFSIK